MTPNNNAQPSPKLSILILNFNRLAESRRTVEHLFAMLKDRRDVDIIAVDNGSTDGTADYLRSCADRLHPVLLPDNLGIEGVNIGAAAARGDYLMILDDDAHPVDATTLDRAISWLDAHPDTGVVACRILRPDGKPFRTWHYPESREPVAAMAFVGCGFVIRGSLFDAVGGYPERFFLYQNEVEVAIRVWRAGFRIVHLPDCTVVHRESPTGRTHWRRVYFPTRNTLWIIRRYFRQPEMAYMLFTRMAIGLFRAVQSGEFRWYAKAILAGLREPVARTPLSREMAARFAPFSEQNHLGFWVGQFLSGEREADR